MKRRPVMVRNNFYLYIFLALTLAIVLSILVLSAIFFAKSEEILTEQVDAYLRNNMLQLGRNVEQVTESARKTVVQIHFDKSIAPLFFSSPPPYTDFQKGTEQLENYRFIATQIASFYLINRTTRTVYLSAASITTREQSMDTFFDVGMLDLIKDYPYDQPFVPIPRSIPNEDPSLGSYAGYSLIFYNAVNPAASNAIVVANLDASRILDNLRKLDAAFQAETFLIDRKGHLVVEMDGLPLLTDLSDRPYVARIVADRGADGAFVTDVGGVPSYVAYTAPDRNGWRIVSIVPNEAMTERIGSLGRMVVFVSLAILGVGILLSFFLARQLFSPIRKALASFENERRDSRFTVKQEMLRNIISGYHQTDFRFTAEKLESLGIHRNPDACIRVTLFRIDGFREFCSRYAFNERLSMKFGVMNILQELLPAGRIAETVDMGDDRIVLLEFFDAEADAEEDAAFEAVLAHVRDIVLQYLRIGLSSFYSPVAVSLDYVTYLYNQVSQNSFYRLFKGPGCIIGPSYPAGLSGAGFADEDQKLERLVHELMVGNAEEAVAVFDLILADIARFSAPLANIAFSHLAYSVASTIETVRRNNMPNVPLNYDLSVPLSEHESVEEIRERFHSAFRNTAQMVASRRSGQYDELLARIRDIVREQYMSTQLSLESIADRLDLSPQYLSRLYRRIANGSIPDLILRTRMDKARELLETTDLPVAQIAERIGFTSDGYFYKVFKEYFGATPGDYRRTGKA